VKRAISNTSPLLYLHHADALPWLPRLFAEIWAPAAVVHELHEGKQRGFDVPSPSDCPWLQVVEPRSVPSEWLTLDLGRGELAVLALALENPQSIVLLDDRLARQLAHAAGLNVWGTLRVLLEAKSLGLTDKVSPLLFRLRDAGMWLSDDVLDRVLVLAGEKGRRPSHS